MSTNVRFYISNVIKIILLSHFGVKTLNGDIMHASLFWNSLVLLSTMTFPSQVISTDAIMKIKSNKLKLASGLGTLILGEITTVQLRQGVVVNFDMMKLT